MAEYKKVFIDAETLADSKTDNLHRKCLSIPVDGYAILPQIPLTDLVTVDLGAPSGDADGGGETHCHSGPNEDGIDKVARRKLLIASALCLIFMIGEATGGALAGSLAIMTDAAHLLTDFASFLISLFAIFLSGRPATRVMSFGWYRAEVVGALVSVLMIWLVTGILVYLAIMRVIHQHYEIDGMVMLITSAIGVAVNMIMAATLHQHGHDHGGGSHGHSHDSGSHPHSHGFFSKMKKKITSMKLSRSDDVKLAKDSTGDASTAICEGGEFQQGLHNPYTTDHPQDHHSHKQSVKEETTAAEHGDENINVRAAFIHVIGDLLQSLGVMVAAFVIYFRPEYKIADPICTFIFSVLVLLTTVNILKDAMNILMEGVPKGLNFAEVRSALQAIPGIVEVHNLRMWSLTMNKTAVSVHLATGMPCCISSPTCCTVRVFNDDNLVAKIYFLFEYTPPGNVVLNTFEAHILHGTSNGQ